MKIIPLSEGVFTIDKSKVFVPFDLGTDDLQQRSRGSLLVEIQPFVVITGKDVLLLDTGLGFKKHQQWQIYSNLAAHGLNPDDITKVLLTHLHKDHAGAVSVKDALGHAHIAFPRAQYYLQEKEMQYAMDTGFPSFMTDEVGVLEGHPNVVLLNGNGKIDGYIDYEVTGAHTPYHQVFWIRENDETVFFGGDDAPQLQQMKNRFVAKYDYDGKKAMHLRQKWWTDGRQGGWTFLFYHDVKTPAFNPSAQG